MNILEKIKDLFTTKVYFKLHDENCKFIQNGEWVDCRTSEEYEANDGDYKIIPLGFSVALPKGYEMIIAPRSSSYKHFKFSVPNSFGIIDYLYRGNKDIVGMICKFHDKSIIKKYDRIAQFRIQLCQDATTIQKLKWLFFGKIKFIYVDDLGYENRGGVGSTGINFIKLLK